MVRLTSKYLLNISISSVNCLGPSVYCYGLSGKTSMFLKDNNPLSYMQQILFPNVLLKQFLKYNSKMYSLKGKESVYLMISLQDLEQIIPVLDTSSAVRLSLRINKLVYLAKVTQHWCIIFVDFKSLVL